MDRIKLKIKNNNVETIKLFGKKIKIAPRISTEQFVAMTDICLQHISSSDDKLSRIGMAKTVFDMMVVHCCTNVLVEGISSVLTDGVLQIKTDINHENIKTFDDCAIIEIVAPFIRNYRNCVDLLISIFNIYTSYMALSGFAKGLPTAESFGDALIQTVNTLEDMNKTNPDIIKEITKEITKEPIVKQVKAERNASKSKKTQKK